MAKCLLIYVMGKHIKYSKELLEEAAQDSYSILEVIKKLGLKETGGGTHHYISKKMTEYGIDISHFLGQRYLRGKNHSWGKSTPLEEILVENSKYKNTNQLRKKLIKNGLLQEACSKCHNTEWNGLPIPLQLDHINGVKTDNRLKNLRILCPNCHAQTETYCGKNIKVKPKIVHTVDLVGPISKSCVDCGKEISAQGLRCKSCSKKRQPNKIDWPEKGNLTKMVEETSYRVVAIKLGVSDNAVRKRIKNH